jgi:aldose 1-epimerase
LTNIKNAQFSLNGEVVCLDKNDNGNDLHSGLQPFSTRLWKVECHEENAIVFYLHSDDGDQGFPGNADIRVTYEIRNGDSLCISYDAISDKDTVFNMTNHSYFNMAGHDHPELAMGQTLCMPARFFNPDDAESIPTGELRSVEGTPMDFRIPKPIGRDITQDSECLNLQGGYDHNFEVFCNPCAILTDPVSGRTMAVETDCPGIQMYSGNYMTGVVGKEGICYIKRGGIALETQFYPDSVNHPEWPQPFVKAGQPYHSETKYIFK